MPSGYNLFDIHRNRRLSAFEGLGNIEFGDRPQFFFAHVLLPHDPFVLDADLNALYPDMGYVLAPNDANRSSDVATYIAGYVGQIQAFNKLALEAIDAIIADNPETVIVIHADHGPRLNNSVKGNYENWQEFLGEECGILSAYYLPGADHEKLLYPSISPVNSFRVVFNQYLDGNYELLEDRTHFSDIGNDEMIDVTDMLHGE